MEVKGSFTVKSIVTAGRRVNEGFIAKDIINDIVLDKFSHKNQYYDVTAERVATLPDATTLPEGWGISFHSKKVSSSKLHIVDAAGNSLCNLVPKRSITLILLENTTSAGVWRIVKSGGSGLGDGNVVLYSEHDIFTAEGRTVIACTVPDLVISGGAASTKTLTYNYNGFIQASETYVWSCVEFADKLLYSKSRDYDNFALYNNEACTDQSPIVFYTDENNSYVDPATYVGTVFQHSITPLMATVGDDQYTYHGTVTVNPFIANIMDGVDEGGEIVDETVFFDMQTTVPVPSQFPTTTYVYINPNGTIIFETARQRGGNVFPASPELGEIFFSKPLRKNFKYTSNGWTPFPCTAVGEVSFVSSTESYITCYPKNEWWWNYKYGDVRNTVVISSGTVMYVPDLAGITVGTPVSGIRIGNCVATVADGYSAAGVANDYYVPLAYGQEVSYTMGTTTYYFITKDGSIYESLYPPSAGKTLPVLDGTSTYPNGSMFFAKDTGRNYILQNNAWVPFPATAIGYITGTGTPVLYPFNVLAGELEVEPHHQIFMNADAVTTQVVLDEEVLEEGHLTVNVSNTVLQSDTYFLHADHKTIEFNHPIEAGLRIEVRWYVPANVTVIRTAQVSNIYVSDFNNFESSTLYSVVHTTKDVTANAPLNVTADWLVTCIDTDFTRFMQATRLDDPSTILYRTRTNNVWTAWSFAYGAWFAGV